MGPNSDKLLGGFDWLDQKASFRRWFATWLAGHWTDIYQESLHQLQTPKDWDNFEKMDLFAKGLPAKIHRLPTGDQLAVLNRQAMKFGFKTSHEIIRESLERFLTSAGKQKPHTEVFKASPWCNHFAIEERMLEEYGKHVPYRAYPKDPDAQLALATVISEFGSFEIHRGVFPAQLRDRRLQRRLFFAVRRLCERKGGPADFARFVCTLLKGWPQTPAGMGFDLSCHFDRKNCLKLVREHLDLNEDQWGKDARAFYYVLRASVFRDQLREALLRLGFRAARQAKERRKGWSHLTTALRTAFIHLARVPSLEETCRDFERAHFSEMRNLTREQRNVLLPKMGNDSDHSIRDLTRKERVHLFQLRAKRKHSLRVLDPDGRGPLAVQYTRAMKDVRKELGQN